MSLNVLVWVTVEVAVCNDVSGWMGFSFVVMRNVNTLCSMSYLSFLGATKHLFNWLCPSVGLSVGL